MANLTPDPSGFSTRPPTAAQNVLRWQPRPHRFKLAASVGVVLAAISCAVQWYVVEPEYQSHALLRIVDAQPYLALRPPFLALQMDGESTGFAQTRLELLRDPVIIGRAIDCEGLSKIPEFQDIADRETAVRWILKRLTVVRIAKSELYDVSFTARSRESALKVVEAVIDTCVRWETEGTNSQRQRMLEVFQEELVRLDHKIGVARQRAKDLPNQADGHNVDVRPDAQMPPLSRTLVETDVAVAVACARIAALSDHGESRPQIQDEAGDNRTAERKDDLSQAQADLSTKRHTAKLLQERIEAERASKTHPGDNSRELQFARDDLQSAEEVRRRIAKIIVHLTTETRGGAGIQVIQRPKLPQFPEGPSLAVKLATVGTAAFFFPFLVLIGWDVSHRRDRADAVP